MQVTKNNLPDNKINQLFILIFLVVSCWLLACAWFIEGEYGDGYATMVNSRFLFANALNYYSYRGPMAAIVLWPVEILVDYFSFHPLSVKPYHFYSAFLHIIYLAGCWLIIRRLYGASLSALFGFIGAIMSVVFIAYAPYLSHDIIPGLLFLILILVVDKWLQYQTVGWALLAILIGAFASLIKQTYAVFWLSLIVSIWLILLFKRDTSLVNGRKCLLLTFLSLVSGLITWLSYGFFIQWDIPGSSVWMRPLEITDWVFNQYSNDPNFRGDLGNLFPLSLYFKNLQNYGITAMLLVLPGLYWSVRGQDRFRFIVAICWLVSFAFILTLGAREVRYLAFLAPLSMVLIIPVIEKVKQMKPVFFKLFLVILLVDVTRSITLAVSCLTSSGELQIVKLLQPIDELVNSDNRLFFPRPFSLPFLSKSPLIQDRYHGIYHISAEHISALYQGRIKIQNVSSLKELNSTKMRPGDVLLFSNQVSVRTPPWQKNNKPANSEKLLQFSGVVSKITLHRSKNSYKAVGLKSPFILLNNQDLKEFEIITGGELSFDQVHKYTFIGQGNSKLNVLVILIKGLCQNNSCHYFREL